MDSITDSLRANLLSSSNRQRVGSNKENEADRQPNLEPTIKFSNSNFIKYYDKPPKHTVRKNFQQEAHLIKTEIGQRKMTYSDFESAYHFTKDIRRKLPLATKTDSTVDWSYARK